MFPQVPQSSLGILRVPQLPHPVEQPPPLRTLQHYEKDPLGRSNWWNALEIPWVRPKKTWRLQAWKTPTPTILETGLFHHLCSFIKPLNIKMPKDPITAKSIRRSTKDHARVNHRSPDYFFSGYVGLFFRQDCGVILLISPLKNVGPFQKPKSPKGKFTFLGLVTT